MCALVTGVRTFALPILQRLRLDRLRMGTFNDSATAAGHPEQSVRTIHFDHKPADEDICFKRNVPRFPFVPNDPKLLDEDCYEAFNIQVEALRKRILSTGTKKIIIGVSGGLDSTHALIVAAKAMDRLQRPRTDIMGFTLRSEEHTSELQSLMRIPYAVFCLKKKK